MTKVIKELTMVNKNQKGEVKHNKFYKIILLKQGSDHMIQTTWGRIGSDGTSKTEYCGEKSKCLIEMRKIAKLRKSHGYHFTN